MHGSKKIPTGTYYAILKAAGIKNQKEGDNMIELSY